MRNLVLAALAALGLFCSLVILDEHQAFAQNAVPVMSLSAETLACATPCSVAANNVLVFNHTSSGSGATAVSAQRVKWTCRNIGTADAFLCRGTTCSSAAYDWILTAAGKDSYTEDTGTVWAGAISAGSTGASLACAGQLR